jgi:hypothetical protein
MTIIVSDPLIRGEDRVDTVHVTLDKDGLLASKTDNRSSAKALISRLDRELSYALRIANQLRWGAPVHRTATESDITLTFRNGTQIRVN